MAKLTNEQRVQAALAQEAARRNQLLQNSSVMMSSPQGINRSNELQQRANSNASNGGGSSSGNSGSSSGSSASTPYMDAWNSTAPRITAGYNSQEEKAAQTKAASLKSEKDIYNAYKKNLKQGQDEFLANMAKERQLYLDQQNKYRAEDEKKSNAGYDSAARQNYINYMQAQKNLPEQLNSLGIRGGASESSLIRLNANYGTNVANNESARQGALDNLATQYAKLINDYETAYRQGLFDSDQQYRQALNEAENSYRTRVAAVNDTYNNTLADIAARRNDALTSGYATALQNDITYKNEQEEIARQKERERIADERAEREWQTSREDKELEDFKDSTANLSQAKLMSLIKKYKKKNPKIKNRVTKLHYLESALAILQRQEGDKTGSGGGGGGGYSRSSYGGGGYSSGYSSGGDDSGGDVASNAVQTAYQMASGIAGGLGAAIGSTGTKGTNNSTRKIWEKYKIPARGGRFVG